MTEPKMIRRDDDELIRESVVAACLDVPDSGITPAVIDAHLNTCKKCPRLIVELTAELEREFIGVSGHVAPPVLARWTDDHAGLQGVQRRLAEQHLLSCRECQNILRLVAERRPGLVYKHAVVPSASWLERLRAWWRPHLGTPFRISWTMQQVAIAALLALAVMVRGRSFTNALHTRFKALDIPVEFLNEPLAYYKSASSADILHYSKEATSPGGLSTVTQDQLLTVGGAVALAQDDTITANQFIAAILRDDPTKDLPFVEAMPPNLVQRFYGARMEACEARLADLSENRRLTAAITSVAIGDLEDKSVIHTPANIDNLCRGLTYAIASDLSALGTTLRVVDRHRVAALRHELELTNDGAREARMRAGLLLGAESFICGSFMLRDSAHVQMDLRLMNTRTAENVWSRGSIASCTSSADVFDIEARLVRCVLASVQERLQHVAGGNRRIELDALEHAIQSRRDKFAGSPEYIDILANAGEALSAEDRGDYVAAIAAWSSVLRDDPGSLLARSRRAALRDYERHTVSVWLQIEVSAPSRVRRVWR